MEKHCKRCEEIGHKVLQQNEDGGGWVVFEISYATTAENIEPITSCPSCRDISDFLEAAKGITGTEETFVFEIPSAGQREWRSAWIVAQISNWVLRVHPTKVTSLLVTGGCTERTNKSFINLALARQWLTTCDREHHQCGLPESLALDISLLLVDLEDECVVQRSSKEKYVAISYVWGNATMTKATRETMATLKRPGCLSESSHDIFIPRTIRDAMFVAKKLGVRYMWVDALCILQDDSDIQRYLDAMSAIYANAYFTLIVADGDTADRGIKGVGTREQGRDLKSLLIRLPGCHLNVPSSAFPVRTLSASPWATRGWTLQEGLFARRALIFNNLMSWICPACYREEGEGNTFVNDSISSFRPTEMDYICQIPRLMTKDYRFLYPFLIERFIPRSFTYESDTMNAFAGIMSFFSQRHKLSTDELSFYGHPLDYFEQSLVWLPIPGAPLSRREVRRQGSNDDTLPSWSCFSWHGPVDCALWGRYVHARAAQPVRAIISPMKQCRTCSSRVPVRSSCCAPNRCEPILFFQTQRVKLVIFRKLGLETLYVCHEKEALNPIGELYCNDANFQSSLFNGEDPLQSSNYTVSTIACEFIAICTGLGPHWVAPTAKGSEGNRDAVSVFTLCIKWNGEGTEKLAQRVGSAVIDKGIWDRLAVEEADIVLE
ncbi:heterokaryon incompatibility protein-domain-containing protein [Pyrenochaeta sp. MPI-SDFR-AT-0127]|nr:heterokaryon incompatibility protein-domain-containing protein [Pyrenochaeta sp. MPI-SDFR-AT-0127]